MVFKRYHSDWAALRLVWMLFSLGYRYYTNFKKHSFIDSIFIFVICEFTLITIYFIYTLIYNYTDLQFIQWNKVLSVTVCGTLSQDRWNHSKQTEHSIMKSPFLNGILQWQNTLIVSSFLSFFTHFDDDAGNTANSSQWKQTAKCPLMTLWS
jgi:uncharacterized membrane protein YjfL (UPF0719 family)